MFCSVIIPTVGRNTLNRAISSALTQTLDASDFEVIVVNDSGRMLDEAEWQTSKQVTVLNTQTRERSVARNTGAAIARGQYLNFLDDDDWLYPQALENLQQLAQNHPKAAWLCGSSQLIDRQEQPIIQLDPNTNNINGNCFIQTMAGEWIPLQSSLIKNECFFAIGGFNPLMNSTEDIDLCRRILLRGDIGSISQLIACIGMGEENSTTNRSGGIQQSRQGREAILNQAGVFRRLKMSANTSNWCGRMVRIYLTSTAWNLRRQNFLIATSRMLFGLAGLMLASNHLITHQFWQGLTQQYQSKTFEQGFELANSQDTT